MIGFNEKKYLEIGNHTVNLKNRVDEIVEEISEKGYKNIFFDWIRWLVCNVFAF